MSQKLDINLNQLEPPNGLFKKVMKQIEIERALRKLRARIIAFSFVFLFSLVTFFPAVKFVWTEFVDSGFTTFFSLLFSDASIVLASWQNFCLSLLEALPVTSLIALSFILILLLISSRFLTRDIKNILLSNKLVSS